MPIGADINPEIKPNTIFGVKLKFDLSLAVLSLIFKRYAPKKYTTIVKNNKRDSVFKFAAKIVPSKTPEITNIP